MSQARRITSSQHRVHQASHLASIEPGERPGQGASSPANSLSSEHCIQRASCQVSIPFAMHRIRGTSHPVAILSGEHPIKQASCPVSTASGEHPIWRASHPSGLASAIHQVSHPGTIASREHPTWSSMSGEHRIQGAPDPVSILCWGCRTGQEPGQSRQRLPICRRGHVPLVGDFSLGSVPRHG